MYPYSRVAISATRFQTSIPPRRNTYIEPPALHASVSPSVHAYTPAAPLQRSMPYTSILPLRHECIARRELHTSMLPLLHDCIQSLALQTERPPRFHVRSPAIEPPALHTSIPPLLPSSPPPLYTPATRLQSSRALFLHVTTLVVRLQNSIPLYPHFATSATRLQRCRVSDLRASTSPTSVARLQRSMPPYRLVATPPARIWSSISLCLQSFT